MPRRLLCALLLMLLAGSGALMLQSESGLGAQVPGTTTTTTTTPPRRAVTTTTASTTSSIAVISTDWAVVSVGTEPSANLVVGTPVTFKMTMTALSSTGGFPQQVAVQCILDGNAYGSGVVTFPGPIGAQYVVTIPTPWMSTTGAHTLTWRIDTSNDPNPANNVGTYTFQVAAPSVPPPPSPTQFVGDLEIFHGHSQDWTEQRYAYFLHEVSAGGTHTTTFIDFGGRPPPEGMANKKVTIYGEKVPYNPVVGNIIRATDWKPFEGTVRSSESTEGHSLHQVAHQLGPVGYEQRVSNYVNPKGPLKWATLLVQFADINSQPHEPSFYTQFIYSNDPDVPSVNNYWVANSYGQMSITGQVVGDWTTVYVPEMKRTLQKSDFMKGGGCVPDDPCLAALVNAAVFAFFWSGWPDIDGVNIEFNDQYSGFSWGSPGHFVGDKLVGITWMESWAAYPGVHGHEMGHNIGMHHAGYNYNDNYTQMGGHYGSVGGAYGMIALPR